MDGGRFFVMVLIIMTAFGNFLHVANRTLGDKPKTPYIQTYFGYDFLDSIVSVYLFGALASFD